MKIYRKDFCIFTNHIFIIPTIQIDLKNPCYTCKNLSIEFHWLVFHARILFLEKER